MWAMSTGQEYESESERCRNRKVVEQLLDKFDIEETVKHYTIRDAVELVYDTSEFSVNSSLSTLRIKQKLRKLMGSDVIRLNDKNYSDKLRRKLKEEYEANMDKKEKQLADAEIQRLRKLMLEGVIPMEKENKNKGHQKKASSQRHKQKNRNNETCNSIMHSDSIFNKKAGRTKRPSKDENSDTHADSEHEQEEEVVTQVELDAEQTKSQAEVHKTEVKEPEEETSDPDNSRTEFSDNIPSTGAHVWKKKTNSYDITEERQNSPSPVPEQQTKNDQSSTADNHQSSPDHTKNVNKGKFSIKESPKVHQLRQEETIEGLYKIAENLV